jgi:hypothetical protein
MRINKPNLLTSCAVGLAALLASAASAATVDAGAGPVQTAPAVASAAVAPATAPPSYQASGSQVILATRVVESAAAYAAYMERAGAIKPDYVNGAGVSSALKIGQSSDIKQLQQGLIAYAAMVALRDPAFVNQMRVYAADPRMADAIAANLIADPHYVAAIPGVDSAAGLVVGALNAQGARVKAAGVAVKQSAYDIQHQKWSLATVANRDARLIEAKAVASAPMVVTEADRSRVISLPTGGQAFQAVPIRGPYTPSVARGLALAALAVLGRAGEENTQQVSFLLVNAQDGFCFNMSKLNLYQCLSVAKPHYEDVFCLGQHILLDTAQCVMKSAGTPFTGAPLAASVVTAVAPVSAAAASSPLSRNE